MLAESDLTLASIATESGLHAQIALDCIDAGVNVIIEKPMAMSMADAEEIIRCSDAKGVKVAACHQNRFNMAVQETRRALEAGRFGRLSHGPSTCAGTATGITMIRLPGGGPGPRMAGAS